jgi:hypothetical protein
MVFRCMRVTDIDTMNIGGFGLSGLQKTMDNLAAMALRFITREKINGILYKRSPHGRQDVGSWV